MANAINDLIREHYEGSTQDNLEKELTALDLAGQVTITDGVTKNLPYINPSEIGEYTRYGNATATDIEADADQITINKTPYIKFVIDQLDEEDAYIAMSPEIVSDATYQIKKQIDGEFFSKVSEAYWKYDTNGFGRNTGTLSPLTLVTGASENISTVFGDSAAGLASIGANESRLNIVGDKFLQPKLTTLGMQINGDVASQSYSRGFRGDFGGLGVYMSSCLYSTTIFDIATNPTAGDKMNVLGADVTFVATIGTTPGNVLIGASAAATADNLVALFNKTAGDGTTYVGFSKTDRARLAGVTATDGTTTVTFTSKAGALIASSTMTAAANDFQAQVTYYSVMEKGAIKMATRNMAKVKVVDNEGNLGKTIQIWARYGLKVTTRSKERMCVIPVVTKSAEA
jgi:hypothetical protein